MNITYADSHIFTLSQYKSYSDIQRLQIGLICPVLSNIHSRHKMTCWRYNYNEKIKIAWTKVLGTQYCRLMVRMDVVREIQRFSNFPSWHFTFFRYKRTTSIRYSLISYSISPTRSPNLKYSLTFVCYRKRLWIWTININNICSHRINAERAKYYTTYHTTYHKTYHKTYEKRYNSFHCLLRFKQKLSNTLKYQMTFVEFMQAFYTYLNNIICKSDDLLRHFWYYSFKIKIYKKW